MHKIPKFVDLSNKRGFHSIASSFKMCYFSYGYVD